MNRKKPIEYALYLLKIRDRSSGEIRQKMKRKDFSEREISEVLAFLDQKKFIDDEKFVRNYIRYQLDQKPQGKFKLKIGLLALKVPGEMIDRALSEYGSDEEKLMAKESAEKWLNRKKSIKKEEKRDKLARYLAGRGFGWEIIRSVLENNNKISN
mgnify:FL=1